MDDQLECDDGEKIPNQFFGCDDHSDENAHILDNDNRLCHGARVLKACGSYHEFIVQLHTSRHRHHRVVVVVVFVAAFVVVGIAVAAVAVASVEQFAELFCVCI